MRRLHEIETRRSRSRPRCRRNEHRHERKAISKSVTSVAVVLLAVAGAYWIIQTPPPHSESNADIDIIHQDKRFNWSDAAFQCHWQTPEDTPGKSNGLAAALNVSSLNDTHKTWCALVEAGLMKGKCPSRGCVEGVHLHSDFAHLHHEMSQIEGAAVEQRPELCDSDDVWPSKDLDFVKTLRSYFPLFKHSLLARDMFRPEVKSLRSNYRIGRFLDAISEGNASAGLYLSAYFALPEIEMPQSATCGYEAIPTVVAMSDVFVTGKGYMFNTKDCIIPKSCKQEPLGPDNVVPVPASLSSRWSGYAEVMILAQNWGASYFHFLIECLPRITLMLDVLHRFPDIKIAIGPDKEGSRVYREQLIGLLGFGPERLVVDEEIHADIAFLPESTPCGLPNTILISRLRFALLKGLYPETGGVAPSPSRPLIVLIVRRRGRFLKNNDEVREALIANFPDYDVVEFYGDGPMHEQLKVFAEASMIVGPHGAGLSNMIVSPLHTMVLEIGPPSCPYCFMHLAIKLQHIYARHLGGGRLDQDCSSNYVLDVDELVAITRDLLSAKTMADKADPPIPPR